MTDAARKMEKVFKCHAIYPRSHPGHLPDHGSQDVDCSLCFRVEPLLPLRAPSIEGRLPKAPTPTVIVYIIPTRLQGGDSFLFFLFERHLFAYREFYVLMPQ